MLAPIFTMLMLSGQPAVSRGSPETKPASQDLDELSKIASTFVQQHASSFAGEAQIKITPPNKQLRLAACETATPFLPSASKLWGRMNLGIRCQKGANWQVYLQVELTIKSDYVVSKQALPAGHVITNDDLQTLHAELPAFSTGVLLKSEQIIGKTLTLPLAQGSTFRQENLKSATVVSQGQAVKVRSYGPGFAISSEGTALNQASLGQLVRIKVASGQVIQGYAAEQGVVDIINK